MQAVRAPAAFDYWDEEKDRAILTEAVDRILGGRPPGHVYHAAHAGSLKVLLKNHQLGDDVAFRFSTPGWSEAPLMPDKYAAWLAATPGDIIGLFMDYETFGEHQWPEAGIFGFLRHLPGEVARYPHVSFALPSEIADRSASIGPYSAPWAISWADAERDVSAWLHNKMQHLCFERLKALAPVVRAAADPDLIEAWRLLQTSDHLYYCSTKSLDDQDIHSYFSPYDSPYLAFINLMNALDDLERKAQAAPRRMLVAPAVVTPTPGAEDELAPVLLASDVRGGAP